MSTNGLLKGTYSGIRQGPVKGLYTGVFKGLYSPVSLSTCCYQAETLAWINQLSSPKPSPLYLYAVESLVSQLKLVSIWKQLDRLWIFAAEQQDHARVSLVNPTGINTTWPANISEVNSPSWTAKQGYTGNGSTSYLNSNYNPSTSLANVKLDCASLGVYSRSSNTSGTDMGASKAVGGHRLSIVAYNGSTMAAIVNASGNSTPSTVSDGLSLTSCTKISAGKWVEYRRGRPIGTVSRADTSVPNYSMYLLARNDDNVAALYSTRQLAMAFIGRGTIDQGILYPILQNFANRIGFNV